jgi:hypothetical protein
MKKASAFGKKKEENATFRERPRAFRRATAHGTRAAVGFPKKRHPRGLDLG